MSFRFVLMKCILFCLIILSCSSQKEKRMDVFHNETSFSKDNVYYAVLKEYNEGEVFYSDIKVFQTSKSDIQKLERLDSLFKKMNSPRGLNPEEQDFLDHPNLAIEKYLLIKSVLIKKDSVGLRDPFDNLVWDSDNRTLRVNHLDSLIEF